MGLNHIYKVIWSKTKNAWVVVSEIAKRDGKSSVKSVVTSLAGKSVAAVMVAMIMCGGVASAATGTQYGTGATAAYNTSVAVGENAQATNSGVTLVGANSQIQGQYSTVVGINNKDYGTSTNNNEILGSVNNVKGQHNIIVGNGTTISSQGNDSSISSDAEGNYNVALGDFQRIGGDKNVSILSDGYILRGKQNVSIGYGSKVTSYITDPNFSTAIGAATARGDRTIAIGYGALAENFHNSETSIAMGTLAQATDSIAIGSNSTGMVSSNNASLNAQGSSVNIGFRNAQATNKAVILGSNNAYSGGTVVYSDGGVVIGHDNVVRIVKNGIIMGSGNDINGESQIAIGTNIQSNTHLSGVKGAVAIGYNSEFATLNKPSGTLNINGVNLDASNYAGNSSSLTYGNTFSIGKLNNERQLKNVAAGEISATSTDAINGSQLYEAVRAVTAGASPDVYMHVNDGTSTQGAGGGNNLGKANEKSGALGNYSIAVGKNAQSQGKNSISIGYQSGTTNDASIAIGGNAHVNSSHSIAIGSDANTSGTYSIAMGASSTNGDKNLALNNSYVYSGNDSVAINGSLVAGNNNIAIGGAYIGAGRTYTRDTFGNPTSTIMHMETAAPTLGISSMQGEQYLEPVKNSIAIGNNAYVTRSNTIVMGDKTFDNIKSSKTATDFIAPTKSKFSSIFSSSINLYHEGTLGNSVYLGHDSYAFTPDALTDGENSSSGENSIHTKKYDATGNIVVSNNTTGGAFGKVSKATINGDEITGFAGAQSVGAVTIGAGDYERRIQNVAAGEVSATSTDGINGSQLYAVADTLSKNISGYMHVNDGTSTQGAGNATTNLGKANEKGGATGNSSIAIGVNATAQGNVAIAIGGSSTYAKAERSIAMLGIVESGAQGGVAIGSNARVQYANGSAFGQSASSNAEGATALGAASYASGAGSVSIGNNNSTYGKFSVGIGPSSGTEAENSVAIGLGTSVNGRNSKNAVAIGGAQIGYSAMLGAGQEGTNSDNSNSIAVGNGVQVFSKNTVAIGSYDNRTRTYFHQLGSTIPWQTDQNKLITPVTVTRQHMYGGTDTGYIEGTLSNSVYLGHESYAFTPDALVDDESHLTGEQSIHTKKYDSTGNIVVSNNTTGGAFGKVSKATINGDEITGFAGAQSVGAVTIGAGDYERRIQNVAAGEVSATSTDGINGSQLYAVADTLSKNMSSYMHINDGTSTQTVGNATTNYGYSGSKAGATGTKSIAGGVNAQASGEEAIAIGSGAKASGEKSISIGTGNEVKGNKSSAIGDPSYIDTTATGTHVHGNDNGTATNPIKASESTFMGNRNLAGTTGTTGIHVVGNNNSVDSSNVMVMGNGVNVGTGLDGAVVLGNASSADQYAAATDSTINGVTFEAAGYAGNTGLNNGSIVSVGATGTERQIKNVAAGAVTATSTDAVNGSQLYKTAETILKMPINMAGDSGDTVGLKLGKTVNIKGSVASGADVTDGNIAVVGHKATSTLSLKMAKNLTGLTSGTFTDATGNQTVINGAGVTVTPTGTGATPISITTSGINAGNQEIKGVKKGTTDDAAVNKKQMDDALAGISSTLTINDGTTDGSVNIKTGKLKVVGESGANALVTTTVSGDTITVGTSTKLQNAVTAAEKSADKDLSNLSTTGSDKVKTLAQDAVKVAGTGLATVSDATAAGVKTYTVNVDEGKLVIDDTTGKIGAAGASQGTVQGKDGVATTQNVASVVNSAIDKTKQALDDAKHNFAGDDATVISRKHGEQLNIKGGASTTASDLTSGNIAVVGDTTTGTLNIKMAKALTGLTSATYTDAAGNTQTVTGGSSTISDAAGNSTVVSKGGVTTTDGTNTTTVAPAGVTATDGTNTVKLTGSGIDAGNTQIKNVGKATTDDAAVNKKQMDDALKGATDNTVSLGSESGSTTAKKLSTTGGIKFNIKGETGANALITTSATGDDVTVAPTAKLTAAVTAAENAANKDLSNLTAAGDTYIKNLAKTAASWNVETNGGGTTAVAGGDTVNFIDGDNIAITNTGRSITIGTAKNVSFDKVTVGGIVLDKNTGINAGNKEIKGIADGTTADAAVNKGQMDAAITAAASGSLSTEKVVAKTLTGDNNLATVTGQTGTAKGETYQVAVSENAVKAVAATAAQDAVKVAGTGLATVSDATAAGVKTYTVNVDEGKLVIDDTTGKLGAAGATQGTVQGKNGVATTQNVADVVNSAIDKTKQALDDAKHNFAGDDATVISRKHGEQLNIKGGASTTATDLTSGNIAVVGDTTSGTLNIKLAKVLTGLTSATYTDAAGNTQTVTGGSSTISDAAGNSTVVSKGGVTTTDGTNTTTVAPSGVTATDGTNTVKLTGSGIDAGNTQIKNVGKATTDDAAVNKKQMDDALKGATDNTVSLGSESGSTTAKKLSTTGGIKFNIKGETGANALITTSATGDDVTIAPTAKLTAAVTAAEKSADKDLSNISPAGETVIKNLAATSAQDAVKVTGTGLATVSDSTTGGVKTYNVDVKTGNLVVTAAGQVGANGTTGAGGAAGADGVATTQNVASAINDAITKSKTDTAQAIADAEHKFDGDTGTTSVRKHGEVLSVKGGVTATTDLTTGNIGVVSDGAGTLNIRLAKVLSGLTSATYTDGAGNTQTVTGGSSTITDGAGNTTTITKGGMTTTDGTNTTTVAPAGVTATDGTHTVTLGGAGISAGGTEIKNVGKATTDDAAVNKKQMDDAVKAATDSISTLGDNKVSLGSDSGTTTAKKLSTTGGIKFNIKGDTGANALITTSATGDDVTIAPTAKLSAAVTAAENSANKDLSNLSAAGDTYIKNLAKTAASWNVETNGAGTTAVAGGETVNFINGDNIAITNTGRSITIGTAKNVSFDKVTVGGIVLDKNTGINAGGKEIKGVANATSADAAVNKGQLDAAVLSAAGGALSIEKVEAGSVANGKLAAGDNNLASVSGLTGTAKNETYTVTVSENAVKAVAQTAAQDAVKVAGTGLATVSDATAAGVKTYTVNVDEGKLVIDDTTGKIGANGATQGTVQGKNGVATTQDVASVVNSAIDKTKQALTDAKHDFAGDDATVISRKHGEQLNIKGGASTTATDLTSGNIAVVGDTTTGTLNIKLAKALTGLTSATYTDAAGNTQTVTGGSSTITDGAGNTTTITKGGMTTTDGTNTTTVAPAGVTATDGTNTVKLTGSGIDAGNTQIKNVGKATTDDAAVNKKQMDDAVKAATDSISTLGDNKVSLGSDSGTTTAKKLSTTGGIKFNIKGDTGANALITTSATGDDVTIAPTAKLTAAVTAAEKSADKDLSNISPAGETVIKNLAATSAQDAVKVTGTGLATVSDSTTGGVKTYNVDVKTGNLVVNAA
ncbi:ESPR-type extended signal peptide-containing protein, partial [Veillonella sp. ACP1]|uniref:ESPR-type extended signal peptide-containing protein n=1 Tax=Veillonella sp. ACP1 TaxID=936588 RepID=UPI0002780F43